MFIQDRKTFTNQPAMLLGKLAGHLTNGIALIPKRPAIPAKASQTIQRQKQTHITVTHVQGKVPVSILHVRGALNAKCYPDLIAKAKAAYQAGTRHIIFDMSDIPSLGISSMLALHSIAVLLRGEEPLDPQGGWETLRTVARDLETSGRQKQFKLLNPQAKVKQSLEQAGFSDFLEIHSDLETAIVSF